MSCDGGPGWIRTSDLTVIRSGALVEFATLESAHSIYQRFHSSRVASRESDTG